jgi:hypothetical protein
VSTQSTAGWTPSGASYEPNGLHPTYYAVRRYDAMRDIWWTEGGWVTSQFLFRAELARRAARIRRMTTSYHRRKRGWRT